MSTYAKSLLFLAAAALLGLGGYVFLTSDIRLPEFGTAQATGPISCDFTGITYEGGQVRAAGDGCNTCVCTETGWSCTKNACFDDGSLDAGTVSGTLGTLDGEYVTDRVCAVDLKDAKKRCVQVLENAQSYAIRLPEGRYWIYAEDDGRDDGYKAYHTAHIDCVEGDCKDRSPRALVVKKGEITEAHPKDWTMPGWIDRVTITPSQRKYDSNYYRPGAKFNVRARDLSSVDFRYLFIKVTAQDKDIDPKPVGSAVLERTDENGWQYWTLPVPEGFSSSRVWPVGTAEEGDFMEGWDLGRTKQDETIEEKLE